MKNASKDTMSTIFGTIINVNMVKDYLAGLNLSGSWKNSFLETLVEIYKESQKFGINPVIPKFARYKRNSKKADIFSENEISTLLSKNNYRDEMFYLWKGCAPIFDSGTSMLHHVSVSVLKINFENEIKQLKSKPFYTTFNEQLQRLPCQKYYDKLEINNLSGIDVYLKNLLSKNINISQERAELLCNILKNQIRDVRICLKSNV